MKNLTPPPLTQLNTRLATGLLLAMTILAGLATGASSQSYSTTDFILLAPHSSQTGNERGYGIRFFVSRNVVDYQLGSIVPSSNAYGFQLCFTGTATPNVDYTVSKHSNRQVEVGSNGCLRTNDTNQGTARPAGNDRTYFYVNPSADNETEGDESIIVTLKNPVGTNLYGHNGVPYETSLTFTIKD